MHLFFCTHDCMDAHACMCLWQHHSNHRVMLTYLVVDNHYALIIHVIILYSTYLLQLQLLYDMDLSHCWDSKPQGSGGELPKFWLCFWSISPGEQDLWNNYAYSQSAYTNIELKAHTWKWNFGCYVMISIILFNTITFPCILGSEWHNAS